MKALIWMSIEKNVYDGNVTLFLFNQIDKNYTKWRLNSCPMSVYQFINKVELLRWTQSDLDPLDSHTFDKHLRLKYLRLNGTQLKALPDGIVRIIYRRQSIGTFAGVHFWQSNGIEFIVCWCKQFDGITKKCIHESDKAGCSCRCWMRRF